MCPWVYLGLESLLSLNNVKKRGPQGMDTANEEGLSCIRWRITSPQGSRAILTKSSPATLRDSQQVQVCSWESQSQIPTGTFLYSRGQDKKSQMTLRQETFWQLGISKLCSQLSKQFPWESWSEAINKKGKESPPRDLRRQGSWMEGLCSTTGKWAEGENPITSKGLGSFMPSSS